MANTLKFGNGLWATKEDSVLAYNDENGNYKPLPFEFERDTNATVVNKSGLIETVGNGIPRIDFQGNNKGALLLEPESTNLYPYSQTAISGGLVTFTAGGATVSTTNNYSISPDGTQNALRFQATIVDDINSRTSIRSLLTTAEVMSTVSLYVKSNTNENYTMVFHYEGGTRDTFVVTPEWQRFSYSEESFATNYVGVELRGTYTSLEADVSLWGFQFENQSYATSVIPTQGGAVTRAEDTCVNAGNDQVINSTEGVLYAEISALADDGTKRYISLNNGTNNYDVRVYFDLNDYISVLSKVAGTTQTFLQSNLYSQTDFNKIAFKYKENDFAFWINGVEVATDTSGITSPANTLNQLDFKGNNLDFFGNVKDVRVYNTALTDSELQALTTI